MVKKASFILAAIFAAFIVGFGLLHAGLIPTHDGEYHVVRFYEFNKAILDGDLYPRWASDLNNGYGVPLFNFVYPLPNYIAFIIHSFGATFIDSFKIEMFLSLIIGGVFFYLWSKEFWGDLGGLVSSIFYTFSPYHIADAYIRGSVGEVLALGIFPAFLWSITRYLKTKNKIFFPMSSLLLALLVFSHNILALMFSAFSVLYVAVLIYLEKDKKQIFKVIQIYALGLTMSSIFWLPALLETKFTVGLQLYDIRSNFAQLYQLLIPSWGSGFSSSDFGSQMSFQIGAANLLTVVGITVLLLLNKFREKLRWIVLFFLVSFFLVFILMLNFSNLVWETVPLMNYFQFPWRLLSLEILICSFLAGGIVYKRRLDIVWAIILITSALSLGVGYISPAYYMYRNDSYYTTRSNFINGTNSPGNAFNTAWFDTQLKKTNQKIKFTKGSGTIENKEIKNSKYLFHITANSDSQITVNTAYFPRWSAYIDGKQARVSGTPNGLFSFNLPKGSHSVLVELDDTNPVRVGNLGFILGSALLLFLFGKCISDKIKK